MYKISLIIIHFLKQHLQNEILYVSRPGDKKKVMFYNDKSATIDINEDFKKMWRSIAVENIDDEKIEEHLEKQVC